MHYFSATLNIFWDANKQRSILSEKKHLNNVDLFSIEFWENYYTFTWKTVLSCSVWKMKFTNENYVWHLNMVDIFKLLKKRATKSIWLNNAYTAVIVSSGCRYWTLRWNTFTHTVSVALGVQQYITEIMALSPANVHASKTCKNWLAPAAPCPWDFIFYVNLVQDITFFDLYLNHIIFG